MPVDLNMLCLNLCGIPRHWTYVVLLSMVQTLHVRHWNDRENWDNVKLIFHKLLDIQWNAENPTPARPDQTPWICPGCVSQFVFKPCWKCFQLRPNVTSLATIYVSLCILLFMCFIYQEMPPSLPNKLGSLWTLKLKLLWPQLVAPIYPQHQPLWYFSAIWVLKKTLWAITDL